MRRRTVLGWAATTGLVGLAGCAGSGDDGSTPTDRDGPELVDAQLRETNVECGNQRDEARASTDDGTVSVVGTIWGRDATRTATIDDVTYDAGAGELSVTIGTTEREGGGVGAQCITEIGYQVDCQFVNGIPDTVAVAHVHDGEQTEVLDADLS